MSNRSNILPFTGEFVGPSLSGPTPDPWANVLVPIDPARRNNGCTVWPDVGGQHYFNRDQINSAIRAVNELAVHDLSQGLDDLHWIMIRHTGVSEARADALIECLEEILRVQIEDARKN